MKLLAALLFLNLLAFPLVAQQKPAKNKIPQSVTGSFSGLYPGVKEVKWEQRGDEYVGQFIKDEKPVTATFNAAGNQMFLETPVAKNEVPAVVIDRVNDSLKTRQPETIWSVLSIDGTEYYKIIAKKKELLVNPDGSWRKTR